MKILIVDDEDDVREVAQLSLGRIGGMDVVQTDSGRHAVAMAREHRPDVVLLDLMMPEMDGRATLAALRADPQTAAIPVIFLTAKAMQSEIARMKALGAAGVITKPFDPITLAAQVRGLLVE
jgi:CheY-like chemotaxis protein